MAHRFSWWSTPLLGLLLGVSGAEQSCELPTFPLVELNDDKFGVTQRKVAALCPTDHAASLRASWQRELASAWPAAMRNDGGGGLAVVLFGESMLRQQFDFLTGLLSGAKMKQSPTLEGRSVSVDGSGSYAVTVARGQLGMNASLTAVLITTSRFSPELEFAATIIDRVLSEPAFGVAGDTNLAACATRGGDRSAAANETGRCVVYVSGGALHMLHIEPARKWEAVGRYLAFDSLARRGLARLRARFGGGGGDTGGDGAGARLVYFITHAVCESAFEGLFAAAVARARSGKPHGACMAHARDAITVAREGGGSDLGGLGDADGADQAWLTALCINGTMSGHGSALMYERERRVTTELRVPVVDGYAMTYMQCWATKAQDGRRYPPLLHLEVMALLGFLLEQE